MIIYPAIDIINQHAVRLYKGNYNAMTIYNDSVENVAKEFASNGAKHIHIVDLDGARLGTTSNFDVISNVLIESKLFVEVGGGIRSLDIVDKYINIGVGRVIVGTSAVTDPMFLSKAVNKYGDKIAVGIDIKDGYVAVKGWTEQTHFSCFDFFDQMFNMGINTIICTDISRDGTLEGSNIELYAELKKRYSINIIASGGVSKMDEIRKLAALNLHGAIVGKALYTGTIDLKEAIEVAK